MYHPTPTTAPPGPKPPPEAGCDHLDDASLLTRFEGLAISPREFRHREHVRLAFAVLARERDLGDAAARYRTALRRFTAAIGAPGKYHETLTWAYLAIIAQRMHGCNYPSSFEFLAAHPDVLDHLHGALARHYDVAAITASPVARAVFVLPERP